MFLAYPHNPTSLPQTSTRLNHLYKIPLTNKIPRVECPALNSSSYSSTPIPMEET